MLTPVRLYVDPVICTNPMCSPGIVLPRGPRRVFIENSLVALVGDNPHACAGNTCPPPPSYTIITGTFRTLVSNRPIATIKSQIAPPVPRLTSFARRTFIGK